MSAFPHDPDHAMHERPSDRSRPPVRRAPADEDAAPLLAKLVELVTRRAEAAGRGVPGDADRMDRLREAVDALEHTLDAVRLLHDSAGESPVVGPRQPHETSARDSRPRVPIPWGDSQPSEPVAAVPSPSFPPFRDQLTGLLSWAGFESIAAAELRRCLRHGRGFTVIRARPARAHPAVLRRAARGLRDALRASDAVGYDAERGLLIGLPETGPEECPSIVGRISAAIAEAEGGGPGPDVGDASCPRDGDSLGALLEMAAQRMAATHVPPPGERSGPAYSSG